MSLVMTQLLMLSLRDTPWELQTHIIYHSQIFLTHKIKKIIVIHLMGELRRYLCMFNCSYL